FKIGAANSNGLLGANINPLDFAAPILKLSTTSGSLNPATQLTGMIIYDLNTHQFKGLDDTGTWDSMTAPGQNAVTSGASSMRIENARIGSFSTGSITAQSSSWLTYSSGAGTGTITYTITNGVFVNTPACVTSSTAAGVNALCQLNNV